MQNIVIEMYEKFHNDGLRNDRALVLWKSDNNNPKKKHNNKNNVGSAWGSVAYMLSSLNTISADILSFNNDLAFRDH